MTGIKPLPGDTGYSTCDDETDPARVPGYIRSIDINSKESPFISTEITASWLSAGAVRANLISSDSVPHQFQHSNFGNEHLHDMSGEEGSEVNFITTSNSGDECRIDNAAMIYPKRTPLRSRVYRRGSTFKNVDSSQRSLIEDQGPNQGLKCRTCGYVAPKLYNMKRHLANKHSVGLQYNCDECPSGFYDKYRLKEHMRLSHNKDYHEDLMTTYT